MLNRIILLLRDYFVVPLIPDAFSLQCRKSLNYLRRMEKKLENTGKALSWNIPSEQVLNWEGLFVGYIINSYNQYTERSIKSHNEWMERIPKIN